MYVEDFTLEIWSHVSLMCIIYANALCTVCRDNCQIGVDKECQKDTPKSNTSHMLLTPFSQFHSKVLIQLQTRTS